MVFRKYRMTSPFGPRDLGNGDMRNHDGIDFVAVGDNHVLTPVDGIVVTSLIITDKSKLTWEWGNYVCVQSDDGYRHYFCHMASRSVKRGQTVKCGDIIGIMGNTGYSFGAHTHYGVRNTAYCWIDPQKYYGISLREGSEYTFEPEHWAQRNLDSLIRKGIIVSPEVWQGRFDEMATKAQLLALIDKIS